MRLSPYGVLLLVETFVLVMCILGFGWSSFLAIMHELGREFGVDVVHITFLQSIFCLSFALTTVPAEVLSRKMDEEVIFGVGALVFGILMVLHRFLMGFTWFLIIFALMGVFASVFLVNLVKFLPRNFPQGKVREFGICGCIFLAYNTGSGISVIVSVPLSVRIGGWRGIFLVYGLISIFFSILFFVMNRIFAHLYGPRMTRKEADGKGKIELAFIRLLIVVMLLLFVLSGVWIGVTTQLPRVLLQCQWTLSEVGMILGALFWSAVVGNLVILFLQRKFVRKIQASTFLGSAAALAMLLMTLPSLHFFIWLGSVIIGFSLGSMEILIGSLILERFPLDFSEVVLGVIVVMLLIMVSVGGALFSILLGLIGMASLDRVYVFPVICSILLMLSVALMFLIPGD
ncbi:MAG: MFS transporter [Candidatus Baldrarchaeia archaeon]